MNPVRAEFADFLVPGYVSREEVNRALKVAESEAQALDRIVLALGLLDEPTLLRALSKFLKLAFWEDSDIQNVVLDGHGLDETYLVRNQIEVISDTAGTIVLTADPTNSALLDEVRFLLDRDVTIAVAATSTIRKLNETWRLQSPDSKVSGQQSSIDAERVRALSAEGPVISYVNSFLSDAVTQDASDVHFEAHETGLSVRFRIKGQLVPQPINASHDSSAVFARLKVLAGLNVTEKRLPQDGRIAFTTAGRNIDLRVSSLPTQFGESIVCRILDPKALQRGWSELGFSRDMTKKIVNCIERPSGLFLVTGPTGSGKTTTLYTALKHLSSPERKIITVEDPIEYNLHGVEQVQVHDEIGLTFAVALRSILRQDPNVIMVGEIRDEETAAMACRAALVGRLVLSTLHTSSPAAAGTRLGNLGIPDYLLKEVLVGVLGQTLDHRTGSALSATFWKPGSYI